MELPEDLLRLFGEAGRPAPGFEDIPGVTAIELPVKLIVTTAVNEAGRRAADKLLMATDLYRTAALAIHKKPDWFEDSGYNSEDLSRLVVGLYNLQLVVLEQVIQLPQPNPQGTPTEERERRRWIRGHKEMCRATREERDAFKKEVGLS